jgi:hypothetical protein
MREVVVQYPQTDPCTRLKGSGNSASVSLSSCCYKWQFWISK